MEPWHIWVIAALLLFIMEIFTPGFAVACLAIGATGSAVASAFGCTLKIQILVFAIVTLISFISVRPLVIKFFHSKEKSVATNTDALIGRTAIVSEGIDPLTGGRVKIDGDDWKAVSADGGKIEAGTPVRILRLDSVIVTVEKIETI